MKGLVSFSLFGDNPIYSYGAIRNCQIWRDSEFDVDCRFYVGKSVPESVKWGLIDHNAQIVEVDAPEDQTATFWRYDALKSNYDYFLLRDVDSRPFDREFYAIKEWLKSNRSIHIIRDHPFHGVPILAGLFGVRSDWAHCISSALPMFPQNDFYLSVNERCTGTPDGPFTSNDFYQVDQWYLRIHIYHLCRNKIMAHDEFFGFERKLFKARFPERVDNMFCGEGFDENDLPRHPEHRDFIDNWPSSYIGRRNR